MTASEPTSLVPIDRAIVALHPLALACLSCGVEVARAEVTERVPVVSVTLDRTHPVGPREGSTVRLTMTRFARCAQTQTRARDLLAEHPLFLGRYGTAAEHRLECALNALDVIAVTPRTRTERDVALLLQHMTIVGGLGRWIARFSPMQIERAEVLTAAARPWSHVGEDLRGEMRDNYAALLADRTETPVMVAAPRDDDGQPGGCLFCGVGAVSALRSQPPPWHPLRASPGSLGGRGASPVYGHLCPPCWQAREDAGATGPTAMESALLRHLGVRRRALDPIELVGLIGWGGLPAGTAPNTRPWEHFYNLEALRDDLA